VYWSPPELGEPRRRELRGQVAAALDALSCDAATTAEFGPIMLRQGLANAARLARLPTVAALAGALPGRPAVIVPGRRCSATSPRSPRVAWSSRARTRCRR